MGGDEFTSKPRDRRYDTMAVGMPFMPFLKSSRKAFYFKIIFVARPRRILTEFVHAAACLATHILLEFRIGTTSLRGCGVLYTLAGIFVFPGATAPVELILLAQDKHIARAWPRRYVRPYTRSHHSNLTEYLWPPCFSGDCHMWL